MADVADTPYQALYRRFRPQRFSEVVGQGHVTRPLQAAVRNHKVAHAYLFSGPRGTGKTSTARILAMALNCEKPVDGEPCGVCESCVAIRQGVSLDVQELDSATNRGIDEMRDLLSRVALGTPGRWKVYIVDEVHQMTSAASSALLKTLEEPPGHVIFVLATTDPQKVLETIRSRTQHFEFRLLGSDVMASLLSEVAGRADIDLSSDALDLVVRRGHGSARDALSALDQVAAAGAFEDDSNVVPQLVDGLIDQDPGAVLVKVAEAVQAGLDPRRLGTELLEYLRNGFLSTRAPSLVPLSEGAAAEAEARARKLGAAALVRAMEVVGQALIDIREAADPRTTLEVALVRLAAPEVDDSRAALLERIERLEKAVGQHGGGSGPGRASPVEPPSRMTQVAQVAQVDSVGRVGPAPQLPASSGKDPLSTTPASGSDQSRAALGALRGARERPGPTPSAVRPAPSEGSPPAAPAARPPAVPTAPPLSGEAAAVPSREELTMAWGDRILPSLRPAVKVYVASGRFLPSAGRSAVYAVPDRGLLSRAQSNLTEVEAALAQHFGRPVPLQLVLDGEAPPASAASGAAPPVVKAAEEDQEDYDLATLEDAPGGVASPEQRLLDAFPGAEEVNP
ncbi:MAG: DNA polymerase III subunit gamma/tau [Acidimicrobiales bacterium]|nr:DNA polymerase III subunit gamma/tau [Acidimicrobiales bacterium]